MTRSAVRITYRQLARLESIDSERLPIAEVHRRWAPWSVEHGLTRPSYERTRRLVHELRAARRLRRQTRRVVLDIVFAHADPYDLDPPVRRS